MKKKSKSPIRNVTICMVSKYKHYTAIVQDNISGVTYTTDIFSNKEDVIKAALVCGELLLNK